MHFMTHLKVLMMVILFLLIYIYVCTFLMQHFRMILFWLFISLYHCHIKT